ncbi:hypothetical protein FA95DRAFT_1572428 [Auriscalpium vulgare]|uniref:Uncharacterized protein n=1 Tax=Auriscalpium vulgare TaxID=40419 RepID=A0ACB8RV18_9AGAM|nr:hypothetical protein FA95DRAFT_1572428 [Auriscalpium vulgare]
MSVPAPSLPSTPESRIAAALFSTISVLFSFGVAAWAGYKLMLLALRRYRQPWMNNCLSIFTIAVNGSCAAIGFHLIPIGPRSFVKDTVLMVMPYVGCGMQVAIIVHDVRETRAKREETALAQLPSDGGERDKEMDAVEKGEKGEKGEPSMLDTTGEV